MKEEQFPLLLVQIKKTQGIINRTQNISSKDQLTNRTATYTDARVHNIQAEHCKVLKTVTYLVSSGMLLLSNQLS